jgi:hypothetical protein
MGMTRKKRRGADDGAPSIADFDPVRLRHRRDALREAQGLPGTFVRDIRSPGVTRTGTSDDGSSARARPSRAPT